MGDEVSLREYVDEQFRAQERAVDAALAAQKELVAAALTAANALHAATAAAADRAIQKAEEATNKRLEGMNEFRQTLSDQAATFITKEAVEVQLAAIRQRIDDLREDQTEQRGVKKGLSASWGAIAGVGGFIFGLVAMVVLLINQFK